MLAMLGIFLAHTTVWLPERFDAFVPILVWFGNLSGYFFLIHTASIFMMRAIADYVPHSWLILISFMLSILLTICSEYKYDILGVRKIKTIVI